MTDTVKVLIADKMDPKAAAIFRERGIEVDEKPGLSPDEFAAIIGDYDGLAVRSSTRVTAAGHGRRFAAPEGHRPRRDRRRHDRRARRSARAGSSS